MNKQVWRAGLIVAFVTAVAGSAVFAAAAPAPAKEPAKAAAPAAPAHQELFWPELWQTLHNPAPWLSMGLDHRFRIEAGENWQTLNDDARDAQGRKTDDWLYQRYRTRWWTKWKVNEDISLNTRLVWEFRTWQQPDGRTHILNPAFAADRPRVTEFNPDEALFDWFNVNIRNIGGTPLGATLGRQDMMFGVGWLVLDGTPLDGSRTVGAFDAARFTYDWGDTNTKIDVAYINQEARRTGILKPLGDKRRGVTEQDEHAGIFYLTNTSWKPVQLEGFLIYKNDNPIDEQLSNFPYGWSRKAETFTLGAAVAGTQGDHWKYRAEGAIQRGTRTANLPNIGGGAPTNPFFGLGDVGAERDIVAYGTLSTLEYQFKDPHDHATHVTYEYASGDDPGTQGTDEQFDLLWGEWPRWSELLIYTYSYETQISSTTNLHRLNVGHRFNINKQWSLTGDYHALWADKNTPTTDPRIATSSANRFRGHLLTSWLRYKFSEQLYGHFLAEYFFNANSYYVAPSDDNAYFLRFNVEYIF
ncbi:MAG: hypothetical protein FJ280_04655 [Planctomycetes bacterium]|nr:hypothetical protein [Planctomycetota bacterium]